MVAAATVPPAARRNRRRVNEACFVFMEILGVREI
jgi:hypothetical protein